MAEEIKEIKPGIDEQFWFDYSKTKVGDAIKARSEASAKIQTFIIWLWGIYTASAAVGIALSKTSYPLHVILLIALPSPILIVAYWLTVWAQIPVPINFKDVVPNTIKEAYERELKIKKRRINQALSLSFIAALLVSAALIGASLSKQTPAPTIQAYLHTKDSSNSIAVSGRFPANTNVIVRIAPVKKFTALSESEEFPYITSESGDLQQSIKLKTTGDKYDVTVEWTDKEGLTYSLKQTAVSQSKGKEKPVEK